jgi:hypothetical protein
VKNRDFPFFLLFEKFLAMRIFKSSQPNKQDITDYTVCDVILMISERAEFLNRRSQSPIINSAGQRPRIFAAENNKN